MPRRAGPISSLSLSLPLTPRSPFSPLLPHCSRTIGAALRDGKADLSSCKLSQSCVANGVDLSNDVLAHGAHGDEKLVDKDGSVFLATPAEWKAALQARLGTPRHCKDVAHALQRSGILFTNDSLQLLDRGAKHSLEGFSGDAWLFELPAECVAPAAALKQAACANTHPHTPPHTHANARAHPFFAPQQPRRGGEKAAARRALAPARHGRR